MGYSPRPTYLDLVFWEGDVESRVSSNASLELYAGNINENLVVGRRAGELTSRLWFRKGLWD